MSEIQQQAHDHKAFLHIYNQGGESLQQSEISPGSKEWYFQANRPGESFYAEIGFYEGNGNFVCISKSSLIKSPPDTLSPYTDVSFVTIPFHISFHDLRELIKDHLLPGEELAEALARLQAEGFPFPFEVD